MAPPTPSPSGGYYVFPASGTIQRQTNPILAEALKASGWAGPFASMTAAHNAINGSLPQQIKNAPGQTLGGVNAIGDFFSRLTSVNTWLRIAEFGIGGILLYVGLRTAFPAQVNTIAAPVKAGVKAVGMFK